MAKSKKPRPTLTEQIKAAIKESELSVNKIAKGAGVQQASLQRFVTGERSLTLESAEKVTDYLGLELSKRT